MKDKKEQKRLKNLNNMRLPGGLAVSSTEMTGMIPAIPEGNENAYSDMFGEIMGVPTNMIDLPDEDFSQAKMPQA